MDSNLSHWQTLLDDVAETDVAFYAKNFHWGYEPIYIADKHVPQYHERFIGYGGTRNTQVINRGRFFKH
jgi:hypothetical protein